MVTKRIVSNFDHMLKGKMYFFFKKSIWKYLIATLAIGFLAPLPTYNGITSFAIYFLGLMLILWPLLIVSAKVKGKKMEFDADIEFNDDNIIVKHRNKALVETKSWDWIKKIDNRKDRFYFVLNERYRFGISIPKSSLKNEEVEFFERKIN